MLGRNGRGYGRTGRGLIRKYAATTGSPPPPPPPPLGNWPGQTQGGWGLSWNGTVPEMNEFYNALTGTRTAFGVGTGQKAYMDWVRIECRMDGLAPNGGTVFDFGSIDAKLQWCKDNHVGAIFDLTYIPWQWSKKPSFTCTGTAVVGGESRVYITGLPSGSWTDMTIHGHPGLPGTQNTTTVGAGNIGSDARGSYLVVNGTVSTNNTTGTVTLGGWRDSSNVVHATEDDKHTAIDPANYMKLAKLAQALAEEADSYGIVYKVEYWNEANGSTFRKPGPLGAGDPDSYSLELMHVYRAIKEWNPNAEVVHSGVSGQTNTGSFHWRPIDWYAALWALMLDTTAGSNGALWKTWIADTNEFITGKQNYTMVQLLQQGWIDDDFWVDYPARHFYCFGRTGKSLGSTTNARMWDTDNSTADRAPVDLAFLANQASRWDPNRLIFTGTLTGTYVLKVTKNGTDLGNTAAISVTATNATIASAIQTKAGGTVRVRSSGVGASDKKVYFEGSNADQRINLTVVTQPTTGALVAAKLGLTKMAWVSTESGGPWHPLAVTGIGWNGGGPGRFSNTPAVVNQNPFSPEEVAVNYTVLRQTLKKVRPYTTGGAMPAIYAEVGDIRDRMGLFTIQRLNEKVETYPGAATFWKQGQRSAESEGSGSEVVPANVLKRAIGADATSRRYYTATTRNGVTVPASALDGVSGF